MAKKKLSIAQENDRRSFFEKLTVAYAPMDDLIMRTTRDTAKQAPADAELTANNQDMRPRFSVRHLGSI